MTQCLVTRLKGSVDDESLMGLNEFRIPISRIPSASSATQGITLEFNKDTQIKIIGDGYFTDKTLSENKGKKMTVSAGEEQHIYLSNGDYELAICDKYALVELSLHTDEYGASSVLKNYLLNIDDLKYCSSLEILYASSQSVYGDISSLQNLMSLKTLNVCDSQVKGDISSLKGLTALTTLDVSLTGVTGDISAVKNFASLQSIILSATDVYGDISAFKNCPSLLIARIGVTGLYGDISSFSNAGSLRVIELSNSSVEGDISVFSNKEQLQQVHLRNTDVSGNISSLNNLSTLTYVNLDGTNVSGSFDSLDNIKSSGLVFNADNVTLTGDYFGFLRSHNDSDITSGGTFSYASSAWGAISQRRIGGTGFTCQTLDDALNGIKDISVSETNSSNVSPSVTMLGTRTTASDAAISTLQGKGFTVTVPEATDAASMMAMAANGLENFGIAYKDGQLVVGPVDLSKQQIYPAAGVTVETFATKEEAERFIKEKGLEYEANGASE